MNKDAVDKGYTGWNLHYKLKAKRSSLSNVNKHNTQSMAEHSRNFGVPKTQTGVKMTQYKQKIRRVSNKRKAPVGGSLSRLPKPILKWKNRSFFGEPIFPTNFNDGRELYETLMAAAGRDLADTWA
jgi:hypothetical protein